MFKQNEKKLDRPEAAKIRKKNKETKKQEDIQNIMEQDQKEEITNRNGE